MPREFPYQWQRRLHFFELSLLALSLMVGIHLGSAPRATANEFVRPLDVQDYFEGAAGARTLFEHAQRVQGVRVAWVNFEALRRDFPELAALDDQQIKDWLIQNFAYIGSEQHRLDGIRNSSVPVVAGDTRVAIRPDGWRRSAAMEALAPDGSLIGMVDIKGIGHGISSHVNPPFAGQIRRFQQHRENPQRLDELRVSDHSDGLMSLGEAIAEVTREQATRLLFNESGLSLETVESYAILALPFDILKERGRTIPAALYLRQANLDREGNLEVPSSILIDSHGGRQHTRMRTMVDFGGVTLRDPRIESHFGPYSETNPQNTRPWIWGHETAIAFAKNGEHEAVNRHIEEMLAPLKNDARIRAAQQRHRLFEQEVLPVLHQNRHLSYQERANVYLKVRQQSPHSHGDAQLFIDQARTLLLQETAATLSPQARLAIRLLISQGSAHSFESFREVFSRLNSDLKRNLIQELGFNSDSFFYKRFSHELFDLMSEAYLAPSDDLLYDFLRANTIKVFMNLQHHLRESNQDALLNRVEQLLESTSVPREVTEILQGLSGQNTSWATQILLRSLQGPSEIRIEALKIIPYQHDPRLIRFIEQTYEGVNDVPWPLVYAAQRARNPQYLPFFQRRLQYQLTLPEIKVHNIAATLSVLSALSISPGLDSSGALLELLPRLSPLELFDALISFRGDPTPELIDAVRVQAEAQNQTTPQQRSAIRCVLERGLSHLLQQQNHPEALEVIQVLMQSSDSVTATQAVRALSRYSDLNSAQILAKKVISLKEEIVQAAALALFERTDSHAVHIRDLALNHENHEIRVMVARAHAAQYAQHLPSRCNRLLTD